MKMPEISRVTLGDIEIAYREKGEGPALVLIHGLGGQSESWLAQVEAFSDRYRVIAWDGPGYGQSGNFSMDSPTVDDYADLLKAFLDAVNLESAHLLGHSFGGIVIAAFNRCFPEHVRSLTFLEPVIGSGGLAAETQKELYEARKSQMGSMSPEEFASFRARHALGPRASPELEAHVARVSYRVRPRGHLHAFGAMCSANIFDELVGVDVPALVVSGEHDQTASPERCRSIAAAIPGARFTVMAGVGHVVYMEAPQETNATLDEFLAAL
jgi:pimeloyl-ACP methyl ester carboxylesterase